MAREGSRERGLMNTGYIDLLTGLLSLARSLAIRQMLLQHFADLPRRGAGGLRGTEGSRRGPGEPSGRRRAQVMAEGSSSLDPSFPTKLAAEAWMLFCCPVPAGRRFLAGVIMMGIL